MDRAMGYTNVLLLSFVSLFLPTCSSRDAAPLTSTPGPGDPPPLVGI